MRKSVYVWICAAAGLACEMGIHGAAGQTKPPASETPSQQIDKEKIRAHVRFLASDLLEGRGTGQRGGDLAAEYLATPKTSRTL